MRSRQLQAGGAESRAERMTRVVTLLGILLTIPCAVFLGWVGFVRDLPPLVLEPPKLPPPRGEVQLGPAKIDVATQQEEKKPKLPARLDPVAPYTPHPTDLSNSAAERRIADLARQLCDPSMEGRGIQTDGIELAAQLIADEFSDAGLRTDLIDGGPFQEFLLNARLGLGATNRIEVERGDSPVLSWNVGRDFTPLSLSGSGDFDLPLVFVGYGITAPEHEYDDYEQIDVVNKAVIVLRREPRPNDPHSRFDGAKSSHHSFFTTKVTNAAAHGAAAIVLVTDQTEIDERRRQLGPDTAHDEIDPLLRFDIGNSVAERRIPVIHVRRSAIDTLIEEVSHRTLSEIEAKFEETGKPDSFELPGFRIRGEVTLEPTGRTLKNVLGLLPGYGPDAGEAIVVGAHYDHLGYGASGSLADGERVLHPGADDNSSGTAVLVEVARRLAAREEPLNRTVLFAAFTAEEVGLVGSRRYLHDPLIPTSNTVAMINFDMVGRLRHNLVLVYGTGTAVGLQDMVERNSMESGLRVRCSPSGFGPSDHAAFHERGVPVLYFFTGFHPEYHRPEDTFDTLNIEGMNAIAQLAEKLIVELAMGSKRPKASSLEGSVQLAEDTGAVVKPESRPVASERPVVIGLLWDRTSLDPGYGISRVLPESPAEYAGLQGGDTIIRFDEQTIQRPQDLVDALDRCQPGERHTLLVKRGKSEFQVVVTLDSP